MTSLRRLARDPTLIASFSRALLEGLTENQTNEQFNARLELSIGKSTRRQSTQQQVPEPPGHAAAVENSQLVLHAAHGTGNWIGAASALGHGGYIYLAYRDRHPVDKGRGNRVYVARSPIDNGIHFDTLCVIGKEDMDAESLERPAVDVTPEGDWDLYLSCATYHSKHWRIERLRARRPQDFRAGTRTTSFPGSAAFGIKDPVLVRGGDLRIWATLHPLTEGDENADQMISVEAYSGGKYSEMP